MKDATKSQAKRGSVKRAVLDYIRTEGPSTPKEVASGAEKKPGSVRSAMNRMQGSELAIVDEKEGRYDLSERVATEMQQSGDPIYSTEASAGDGSFKISEEPVGRMPVSQSLSAPGKDVFWMPVRGDSMGEKYQKHTLVPVAELQPHQEDISEDDVYLIRLEGAIQIKRLQRLPGQRVRIISDNDAYPNQEIPLDDGYDFEVLGRVLV